MIYFESNEGIHVLILEPVNLKRVLTGKLIMTPDQRVVFGYTPDAEFTGKLAQAMLDQHSMTLGELQTLLEMAIKRPAVHRTDRPA